MSASCCDDKDLKNSQTKVLWAVLIINLVMFGIEFAYALVAHSLALMGDSLDMFGDFLAYSVSLYVVKRGAEAKAKAARIKGFLILVVGTLAFLQAVYRFVFREVPDSAIMGVVGAIALGANLICLALLTRHRKDDINFESVWICSRNDIIANVSVLLAGAVVFFTVSPWPDLVVGVAILLLFYRSAWGILRRT